MKTLEIIKPGQTPKKKFTTPIPDLGKPINIMKTEAAKLNIHIPIKPNPNIYLHIKSDRDEINKYETAGIYKINYKTTENQEGCYIGVTKRKIKDCIEEHKADIKHGRQTTIAREALLKSIEINFKETGKLVNYNNYQYGYCRESLEIGRNKNACNDTTHFVIDEGWRTLTDMRGKTSRCGKKTVGRREQR